jgi:hypothetical protein
MSQVEKWFLITSSSLTAISGTIYGIMKYLVASTDPYAVVNHPWQPFFLKFHILAAPFMVFSLGMIFRRHILERWMSGSKSARRSGVFTTCIFLPMVLSGYLIQVVTGGTVLEGLVLAHLVTAGAFVAGLAMHRKRAFGLSELLSRDSVKFPGELEEPSCPTLENRSPS